MCVCIIYAVKSTFNVFRFFIRLSKVFIVQEKKNLEVEETMELQDAFITLYSFLNRKMLLVSRAMLLTS